MSRLMGDFRGPFSMWCVYSSPFCLSTRGESGGVVMQRRARFVVFCSLSRIVLYKKVSGREESKVV